MIVCIAEKPSAARDIAKVLGANERREGYMEGNGYQVTWTFGHLCTLKEPHEYTPQWQRWSLASLPMIPDRFQIRLIEDRGVKGQFEVIKSLVAQAEMVVNCGDAGQEGELIQRWVLQLAECACPVKRLWLSSMTEEAIREAFTNLRDASEYQNLYYAGLTRAIGDWLLGMNATRLYTLKYGTPDQTLLSVGRVQTPTLALIVERYEEINNFVPQPYWEIKTTYRGVLFVSAKGRYSSAEEAHRVVDHIALSPLAVVDLKVKKGTEGAPRLFDLTSLQVECNKKLGLSAEETLKAVQSLYEKKIVTYPRVDTTYLTDDIYNRCPRILSGLKSVAPEEVAQLLQGRLKKSKKFFDNSKVTDHHAIIPTGQSPVGATSDVERRVFDLILRRFLGAFYPDLKYEQTTVLAEAAGVKFKASGNVVIEPGWKVLYTSLSDTQVSDEEAPDEEEKKELPPFKCGESGAHAPKLLQKETRPPKNYTEGTLLNAMETAGKLVEEGALKEAMKQKGIGRPSTRAAIIETLLKRKYIRREHKTLLPTEQGIRLIRIIQSEELKSVRLTGEWEYKLRLMDRGEYEPARFLEELKQMVTQLMYDVKVDNRSVDELAIQYQNPDVPCPKCGKGRLLRGKRAFGCSRYAEGCHFTIPLAQLPEEVTPRQLLQYVARYKSE